MSQGPIRLCRVVTVPITFKALFWGQLRYLSQHGFEITLVSSPGPELDEVAHDLGVRCQAIDMARDPAPWRDLKSLFAFTRWLKTQKFDIIHSSTPKAGIVAALAGWMCRVPVRTHTYTGQVWAEMRGLPRTVVKGMDAVIARLNTHCFTDSVSQRQYLIEQGVISPDKLEVIGAGSVAGVDLARFQPERWSGGRAALRQQLGLSPDAVVIAFVGRLRADKGLNELVSAFQQVQARGLPVDLLLIGPPEFERRPLSIETQQALQSNPDIHITGYTPTPEQYLSIADVFAFPSYREGFGSSVIEAAAMGLPSVATRVTGCVDSVVDGVTGRLVPARDAAALAQALAELVTQPDLRRRWGEAARQRVMRDFDAAVINRLVAQRLTKLVADHSTQLGRHL